MAGRQTSEAERQEVLRRQGDRCSIDNAPLGGLDDVEYNHCGLFAEGGALEIANIGAVCKKHTREKSSLSLSEYRDRLALREFFEDPRKRRLDDLLASRLGPRAYGLPLQSETNDDGVDLYLDSGTIRTSLARCPSTDERYSLATLPVVHLHNDVGLQPRTLEPDRVWELYEHPRIVAAVRPLGIKGVPDRWHLYRVVA